MSRALDSSFAVVLTLALGCSGCHPPAQRTPPPATASAKEVALAGASILIGAGDIARCDATGDEATALIVDSILLADSVAKVSDAVFTLGDNAYTSGSTGQWTNCFTPSWGDPQKRIMKNIKPSPGNHEYYTAGADPYYKYFGKAAGPAGKGYYSYDIGEWHAVVLNTEIVVSSSFDLPARKEQLDWLDADLKASTKECTVAYWHHPRFSSGSHGSDVKLGPIWQTLHRYGVDLVLSGHDHHYERFAPMNAEGVLDTLHGIPSFVIGTGGGELRGMRLPLAQNSLKRVEGHYGVLLLTLGAKEYRSAFISVGGYVWDPSGGKCHGAPAKVP
ncbi:MAG: metallophosphoesterase [Gemmatimonas sp.]